ncbi:hypothetical protein HDU93_001804, partial [Gonapodya sp. JEL0774]
GVNVRIFERILRLFASSSVTHGGLFFFPDTVFARVKTAEDVGFVLDDLILASDRRALFLRDFSIYHLEKNRPAAIVSILLFVEEKRTSFIPFWNRELIYEFFVHWLSDRGSAEHALNTFNMEELQYR